jgi:nucleotide-binding universal stress UspA family protein
MITLKRILVPTDFSDFSKQAARYGCELAARFESNIDLLHVIELPVMAMPSPGAPLPDELIAGAETHAKEEIERWLTPEMRAGLDISHHVCRGAPFLEIVRFALENNSDLIVIGTHGRTGLVHALIGSVAEKVVRKAPCPVLSVRPEGHQFVMPWHLVEPT